MEEVKRTSALQCTTTLESLGATQSQLSSMQEELEQLKNENEDEARKRRLAEERYSKQQDEYETLLRKRKKEVQDANRAQMEAEKRLAEEAARVRDLQLEISKVRGICIAEINSFKLSYESQIQASHTDVQRLSVQREEDAAEQTLQCDRMAAERSTLQDELRRQWLLVSDAEEGRRRAEQEALGQLSVIMEEGQWRGALEDQLEVLVRQRESDDAQHREELAELTKRLEEKSNQLAYITHSLSEETRRRTTVEEGQSVMEETLAQLHIKLASSSVSTARLKECEEELGRMRCEIERQVMERSRVEQNVCRLQGRIKDLQSVRDGLESQVEVVRKSNQEEVNRRKKVETELEQTTLTIREYTSTIAKLHESQEKANTAEKSFEEEILRLKGELEKTLRQNETSSDHLNKLSFELKAVHQNVLQEQACVKETKLCNENLSKSLEDKSQAMNQNSVELQKLKEQTETLVKEKLRLEEVLLVECHEKDELTRSKLGGDEDLLSQIAALELQLQSSLDCKKLVNELSSEREKLKLEIGKTQKQAVEVHIHRSSGLLSSFQIV